MTLRRAILFLVLAAVVALIAAMGWAMRHAELEPISTTDRGQFDTDLIEKGEMLVAIGGCASCHDGKAGEGLVGGARLVTPFGAIYSTNITPDAKTGVGRWSEQAFRRAMREGVDRDGNYLYPAFPYDHYTNVSDEDVGAIYAYLMSQPSREAPARANELRFPFNIRLLMAGWNLLFLQEGPFRPDPTQDDAWNRGAYLVEGLGHCAACHSPRDAFGARDRSRDYAGGDAEGWLSPALNAASPAPVPWDEEALINYFYDGWDENHGLAAGPMREVVGHTAALAEEDVRAIALYLLSMQEDRSGDDDTAREAAAFAEQVQFGAGSEPEPPSDAAAARGFVTFEKRCVNCHRSGSESVPLGLTSAVAGPDPRNLIHVILEGVTPSENAYFVRPMPGFSMLSDDEVADLVTFIRDRFARGDPWPEVEPVLNEIRAAGRGQ